MFGRQFAGSPPPLCLGVPNGRINNSEWIGARSDFESVSLRQICSFSNPPILGKHFLIFCDFWHISEVFFCIYFGPLVDWSKSLQKYPLRSKSAPYFFLDCGAHCQPLLVHISTYILPILCYQHSEWPFLCAPALLRTLELLFLVLISMGWSFGCNSSEDILL